ncbi:unnamed protein product [Effrenium voratum]|nr:unnamed protein product [Effrenium voratum]
MGGVATSFCASEASPKAPSVSQEMVQEIEDAELRAEARPGEDVPRVPSDEAVKTLQEALAAERSARLQLEATVKELIAKLESAERNEQEAPAPLAAEPPNAAPSTAAPPAAAEPSNATAPANAVAHLDVSPADAEPPSAMAPSTAAPSNAPDSSVPPVQEGTRLE